MDQVWLNVPLQKTERSSTSKQRSSSTVISKNDYDRYASKVDSRNISKSCNCANEIMLLKGKGNVNVPEKNSSETHIVTKTFPTTKYRTSIVRDGMNDVNILTSQGNMLRNINDAFSDENSTSCSVYNTDTLSTHMTNIINIPYLGDVNVISAEMSCNSESSLTDIPKMSTSGHHTVYTDNYHHSLQHNDSLPLL
jgi:hypothetical protein